MSQLSLIKQPAETQHHNKRSKDFTNILAEIFLSSFFFFPPLSLRDWLNISCFQLSRMVFRSLPLLSSCWLHHFSRPCLSPGMMWIQEASCRPCAWLRGASATATNPLDWSPSLQAWSWMMLMTVPNIWESLKTQIGTLWPFTSYLWTRHRGSFLQLAD